MLISSFAIGSPFTVQHKIFWCLNDLGNEYAMFTTSMMCISCSYTQMLSKLVTFEMRYMQKRPEATAGTISSSMTFVGQEYSSSYYASSSRGPSGGRDRRQNNYNRTGYGHQTANQNFQAARQNQWNQNPDMHFQIARQNQWSQNPNMHNPVFSSQRRGFGTAQSKNNHTRVPRYPEFQSPTLTIPNDVDSKAASKAVLAQLICQICF